MKNVVSVNIDELTKSVPEDKRIAIARAMTNIENEENGYVQIATFVAIVNSRLNNIILTEKFY